MAKDKKKKKDKGIEELQKDYEYALEMLKAKNDKLNGLIREANLYLSEIKEIRDNLNALYEDGQLTKEIENGN